METKFISIASAKGGVGKSSLTCLMATSFQSHYHKKVAIIDIDPQSSIVDLRTKEEKDLKGMSVLSPNSLYYKTIISNKGNTNMPYPDLFKLDIFKSYDEIQKEMNYFIGRYDYVFIDFPGSLLLQQNTIKMLKALDYLFIPFYADQNTSMSTIKFLDSLTTHKDNGSIKGDFYVFLNRFADVNGKNGANFQAYKQFLSFKYNLLDNVVYENTEVERSSTIIPFKISHARKSLSRISEEIFNIINK